MSPEMLAFFAEFIEKESGIVFQSTNLFHLKTRLEDFLKQEKIGSLEDLHKLIQDPSSFLLRQKLIDMSTNNETLFFRDSSFYAAFERYLIDVILPDAPREIRIWSAASSTGQEAVSIAILLDELSEKHSIPPFRIIATDICERALAKARSGIYTDFELSRGLSETRLKKYFQRVENGHKVIPSLMSRIHFSYNNLTRSRVNETFHFVLCRNVLIYQRVDLKKIVLDSLSSRLEPNGGLMLGVGETMYGITDNFVAILYGNYAVYKSNKKINSKVI